MSTNPVLIFHLAFPLICRGDPMWSPDNLAAQTIYIKNFRRLKQKSTLSGALFYLRGFSLILTLCLGYFAGVAFFFSIKTTDLPPAGIS